MTDIKTNTEKEQCVRRKLTVFNFIMTAFIVLSHWTHFYRQTNPTSDAWILDFLDGLYVTLGLVSLATFFLAAGFLFYYGVEKESDVVGKMKRRLLYLGVPFAVWNTVYLIYNIAYGIYKDNLSLDFGDIILGFTLNPFATPLWYIFALLLLACTSPVVAMLKRHPRISAALVAVIFVACLIASSLIVSGNFYVVWIKRLLGYIPLYMLGAHLGMHHGKAVMTESYRTRSLTVASLVMIGVILVYLLFFKANVYPVNLVLYQCLPVLIWIAVPASAVGKREAPYFMQVSFFVYGLHYLIITVLNWLFVRVILKNVDLPLIVDLIIHLALIAALYAISLLVAFVAKKILPDKAYRVLAGGTAGRKLI